jgi:hypothetical protein
VYVFVCARLCVCLFVYVCVCVTVYVCDCVCVTVFVRLCICDRVCATDSTLFYSIYILLVRAVVAPHCVWPFEHGGSAHRLVYDRNSKSIGYIDDLTGRCPPCGRACCHRRAAPTVKPVLIRVTHDMIFVIYSDSHYALCSVLNSMLY